MALNVEKVKWLPGKTGPGMAAVTGGGAGGGARSHADRTLSERSAADERFAAWVLSPAARIPKISTRARLQAVLFDLDGVLVDTAEFHYLAWQRLADELGVAFDRRKNEGFRGVNRMDCLEKLLGAHRALFVAEEKRVLADRKNAYYLERVKTLTPHAVAAGALSLVAALKNLPEDGVRLAVVSASKNARLVLHLLGITDFFDAIIDGADVTRGKPDPQCFLLAAERLRARPELCTVIEDAEAGIKAGRAAGMRTIGIHMEADVRVKSLAEVTVAMLEIPSQKCESC